MIQISPLLSFFTAILFSLLVNNIITFACVDKFFSPTFPEVLNSEAEHLPKSFPKMLPNHLANINVHGELSTHFYK